MKLFLGINVPDISKKAIEHDLADLKQAYPYYQWVEPKNYVIEIIQLGEIAQEMLLNVKQRIENLLFETPPFHLFTQSINVHIDKKITLYIDFQRQKQLEMIETMLAQDLGIQHSYKFVPQLVVAKWKIPSKQQYFHLKSKLENKVIDTEFAVHNLQLYSKVNTSDMPTMVIYRDVDLPKLEQ